MRFYIMAIIKKSYPVIITKDSKHFWVVVPDVPGAFCEGTDLKTARAIAKHAIENILNHADNIPEPTPISRLEKSKETSGLILLIPVEIDNPKIELIPQ